MASQIPQSRLRLLSLDGGGVRGLSSIMILKDIMQGINQDRPTEDRLHPWQVFDMIGGTSTGGLLAIMLGRLHMSVDDCERTYMGLSERIFNPRRNRANLVGQAKDFIRADGKFDSEELSLAIKETVKGRGFKEDALLKEENPSCKVFVCAVLTSNTQACVLRSYENPESPELLYNYCRIWEACRATSAATTFFDPITIGPYGQCFADGAVKYNNPIQLLQREAGNVWPTRIQDAVLVSIGTGSAPSPALEGNITSIAKLLKEIVVQTETTADDFFKDHPNMTNRDLLFRFNVYHGLAEVGLEEYKESRRIADTTYAYMLRGEVRQNWRKCVGKLGENANQESQYALSDHEKACLRSLSFPEIYAREDSIEPAFENSGSWLFQNADFQSWLQRERFDEHQGFFWVKGKPGSGKSTLMKQLHSYLEECSIDSVTAAFFFDAGGGEMERSIEGLFRTLLHRLCERTPAIRAMVMPEYVRRNAKCSSGWKWQIAQIKKYLKLAIRKSVLGQRRITLIIDGLNVCNVNDGNSVLEFLEDLASTARSEDAHLNICVSSTHWPQFEVRYGFKINTEDENQSDIANYVHQKMNSTRYRVYHPNYLAWFEGIINQKASGNFLWVSLVVRDLLQANSAGATFDEMIMIVQESLPDLTEFYRRRVQSAEGEDRIHMLRLLILVSFARGNLSVAEIRYALAFGCDGFSSRAGWATSNYVESDERMESRICEQSKGLIEIRYGISTRFPDDSAVLPTYCQDKGRIRQHVRAARFIHESVFDFLLKEGFKHLDLKGREAESFVQGLLLGQRVTEHEIMKQICLNCLKHVELLDVPTKDLEITSQESCEEIASSLMKDHPLIEYIVDFLFFHARRAEKSGVNQDRLRADLCNNDTKCFGVWIYLHDLVQSIRKTMFPSPWGEDVVIARPCLQGPRARPLHIFAQFGLLTKTFVAGVGDVNIRGGVYQSALIAATAEGHKDAVDLLLCAGADPLISTNTGTDIFPSGINALHWAAAQEDPALLDSLLANNMALFSLRMRLETVAAIRGKTNSSHDCLARLVPEDTVSELAVVAIRHVAQFGFPELICAVLDKCEISVFGERLLFNCITNARMDLESITKVLKKMNDVIIPPYMFESMPFKKESVALLVARYGKIIVTEELINSICLLPFSMTIFLEFAKRGIAIGAFTRRQVFIAATMGTAVSAATVLKYTNQEFDWRALLVQAAKNKHHGPLVIHSLRCEMKIERVEVDMLIEILKHSENGAAFLKITEACALEKPMRFPKAILPIAFDCFGVDATEFMLERCGPWEVTEELLRVAARSQRDSERKIAILLDQDLSAYVREIITPDVRLNVDHAISTLKRLVSKKEPPLTTEEAAVAAASNPNQDLEAFKSQSEHVSDAKASKLSRLIAQKDVSSASLVSAILESRTMVEANVYHFLAAASNPDRGSEIFEILEKYGKIMSFFHGEEYNDGRPRPNNGTYSVRFEYDKETNPPTLNAVPCFAVGRSYTSGPGVLDEEEKPKSYHRVPGHIDELQPDEQPASWTNNRRDESTFAWISNWIAYGRHTQ